MSIKNATAVVNLCPGKLKQTILDDTILGYRKIYYQVWPALQMPDLRIYIENSPKGGRWGKCLGRTVNNANLDIA